MASVIGRDLPGGQVLDLLDDHAIAPYLWADSTRPTTNKSRFILRGQLRPDRFDFESKTPIPGDAAKYLAACPIGDALLIQDYGKGVCKAPLLRSLLSQASAAGVPVLVDPARGRDWRDYDGCTVIKANRIEAAQALGCHVSDPPAMMARRLAIRQGCPVVVTAGEIGLWWSDGQAVRRVPAVPVHVRDVCGAGVTVLATLGVVMATGGTFADGCRQAVRMAAEQVCHVGVRPILQRSLSEIQAPNDRTCHEAHNHNSRADLAGKPDSLPTGGGSRRNPTGIADADGGILHVASFGQQSTC